MFILSINIGQSVNKIYLRGFLFLMHTPEYESRFIYIITQVKFSNC